MKRTYVFVLLGFVALGLFFGEGLLPRPASAQLSPQEAAQINEGDLSFSMSPEVPGAFQDVTITVDSYLTNVSRAYFVWKKDGVTELSSAGANEFTFTTGDIGEKTTIDVGVLLPSGETIQKTLRFNPAEADLVWEGADSYVPPFYRGRALPTSEGTIRVLAIPQVNNTGTTANINNFVFRWTRNDGVLSDSSGFNKSSLLFQQSYLNDDENIEVVAQDNSTGATARGSISVPVFSPKILFYIRDPINGVDWFHELGDQYEVGAAEKTVLAAPYFFSPPNPLSGQLKYTWTINGQDVPNPSVQNMLTLKSGETKGFSNLTLKIENTLKLFLEAEKNITINLK